MKYRYNKYNFIIKIKMMTSRVPLLEKFGVSFIVVSYFGSTHQGFLLLSKLNKRSRAMLDENYEAFLNSMIGNNVSNKSLEWLNLPWDLFKYNIVLRNNNALNRFIKMISNINDRNGFYFNEHFMHSRLWIEEFILSANLAEKVYPHLELLKSTEAIQCTR